MAAGPVGVCTGLDWSDPEDPMMRISPVRPGPPEVLVPLRRGLRFRITDPGNRYCCGWFDYLGAEPGHRGCATSDKVLSGLQCPACRTREGFAPVHQSHRSPAELPASVRDYMARPHWLYLAVFADGSVKVGTVAQVRLGSRLTEQGPIAARYVARAGNGIDIRQAEAQVSSGLGIRQAVSSRRKLAAVERRVDVAALTATLETAAATVLAFLPTAPGADRWEVAPEPVPRWQPPALARALVDATPLVSYPDDLATGQHSLFIGGASGPVVMFTVEDSPGAGLYAADLSGMRGVRLAFGEYRSQVSAVQPALF